MGCPLQSTHPIALHSTPVHSIPPPSLPKGRRVKAMISALLSLGSGRVLGESMGPSIPSRRGMEGDHAHTLRRLRRTSSSAASRSCPSGTGTRLDTAASTTPMPFPTASNGSMVSFLLHGVDWNGHSIPLHSIPVHLSTDHSTPFQPTPLHPPHCTPLNSIPLYYIPVYSLKKQTDSLIIY